jgi:tetratricopeptide (TPR) repeat protein
MSIRGALLIACALTAVASADTPQQQADKLFAEGRELLTVKKDAKAACEKFEAAISLDATATGTMLNLGLCYETLGKYATSIAWFRKAQSAASEAHLDEYEAAAKEHTRIITAKVPSLQITVSIPEAEVRIDGKRIASTEYGKVEVDPGVHEVVGITAGKKKVVQTVDVPEGTSKAFTITFTEDAVPVYVDRGKGRKRGAIVLGGVGIAALAFSGIYSYVQKGNWTDAGNDVTGTPLKQDRDKNQDDIATKVQYIGTGAFILGCAAVVAAGVLYFTAPDREQISDGTAFAPMITHDSVGLAASGSF